MNFLRLDNRNVQAFIKYSPYVFFIGVISRTFPVINLIYYLAVVILVLNTSILVFYHKEYHIKFDKLLIIFLFPIYTAISSFWSLYPAVTLQRSVYLILLFSGIFSMILLSKNILIPNTLKFLFPANLFVILISFFSLITGIPDNSWSGGNGLGFMGLAGHQNTLASAILFTLPGLLVYKIKDKGDKSNVTSILYFLLFTFNFLLILLTYSRASILALVIGVVTYLLLTKSKKIIIIIIALTAGLLILFLTIQPLNNLLNNFLSKDGGNILDRRIILWEPSYEAAKKGGLSGLGYGVSAPEIKTPVLTGSHYIDGRYIREKGNSVFALIEETGLIGLILFLIPLALLLRQGWMNAWMHENYKHASTQSFNHSILIASLVAFLLHAQFEAWWVGPGSVQFPIYLFLMMMASESVD